MNFVVQRGKVRSQVIKVPEGLPELLSDVTREVLRCQPTTECLCQFMIDYLHSVIAARDKARLAKGIIDRALNTVDEIIADLCICDITKEKANFMAAVLEECFRRFVERRRCEERTEGEIIKFQDWDMLDEIFIKCNFTEKELLVSRPLIEDAYNRFVEGYMRTAEGSEGTEAIYQYFKMREEKRKEMENLNYAATKIQSNFRGFLVRRSRSIKKVSEAEKTLETDFEEVNRAASIIQKYFRRYIYIFKAKGKREQDEGAGDSCDPISQVSMQPKNLEGYIEEPAEASLRVTITEAPTAAPEPVSEPPPEPEKSPEEPPPPPRSIASEPAPVPEPPAAAAEEPPADAEEPPAEAADAAEPVAE